jgi:hypothetical protein
MTAVPKERILKEIRRTAEANGGVPLGVSKFFRETGIKESDWHGKHWARWGDALKEAGFEPNELQAAYADDVLIERLVDFMRELGHFPVRGELKIKSRNNPAFPSHNAFARLGPKQQIAAKILDYIKGRAGYEDVMALCEPVAMGSIEDSSPAYSGDMHGVESAAGTRDGYVYMGLLKLGREKRYKIGKAVLVGRRTDQISLQLPEELELVHVITTDDAYGIEDYWHRRFAAKNTKGEWFTLSRLDVDAFRRRKFM